MYINQYINDYWSSETFVNDNIGDIVKQNNITGDFAYKLNFDNSKALSFGLKAGVSLFDANINQLVVANPDPNFQTNVTKTFFNLGVGVFYNASNYYLGASVPNLLNQQHLELNNGQAQGTEVNHLFVTGGYIFDLAEKWKLKPAFMTKVTKGSPVSADVTLNTLYNDKLEFGVGYRLEDAISGMINFKVMPTMRIGYAYDYNYNNLGDFSNGSHEVFLLFDINTATQKGYDKSPRFF